MLFKNRLDPSTAPGRVDVEVADVFGRQSLTLSGVGADTSIAEIAGQTRARLTLPPEIGWQVEDARTARLLRDNQTVGDVATEGKVELRVLPDAKLG